MRIHPNFSVLIKSNCSEESEKAYQTAWLRLHNIKTYLVEAEGIYEDRLLFKIENFGKENTILIDSPPNNYEPDSKNPVFSK